MAHREPLHVEFVDHGFVPGNGRWAICAPGESGIDDLILWHSGGIVAAVERKIFLFVPDLVSKMCVAPTDCSVNLLAIGIEQKFVMIKTVALLRGIGPIDAISVQL